jgi:hypothetical protein
MHDNEHADRNIPNRKDELLSIGKTYYFIILFYNKMSSDCEKIFLENNNVGRFNVAIGQKECGKSYLTSHFLYYNLKREKHKNYHLVIPNFRGDKSSNYSFLENYKNDKNCNIYIYSALNNELLEKVTKSYEKQYTFFLIDDGSGLLMSNKNEKFLSDLLQLCTCTRHNAGITIFFNMHSSKRILMPSLRQNIDNLFVFDTSYDLLDTIYKEWFKIKFRDFDAFLDMYENSVLNVENGCFYFNGKSKSFDLNVKNWDILKINLQKITNNDTKKNDKEDEKNDKEDEKNEKDTKKCTDNSKSSQKILDMIIKSGIKRKKISYSII